MSIVINPKEQLPGENNAMPHHTTSGSPRHRHRYLRLILTFIAAAALAAAAAIFAWTRGAFLPRWIVWEEKKLELNENSSEPSAIHLSRRQLTVSQYDKDSWTSPDDILVQDFLWCDINHDDKNELILLCWRIGRYGNARPYWVEEDEKSWSQHIYIYEWRDGEIHPLWMASDIGMDVVSFDFDEATRLLITETSGRVTYWDWLSWGLTFIGERIASPLPPSA